MERVFVLLLVASLGILLLSPLILLALVVATMFSSQAVPVFGRDYCAVPTRRAGC